MRKLAKVLKVSADLNGFRNVDFATGWTAMEKVAQAVRPHRPSRRGRPRAGVRDQPVHSGVRRRRSAEGPLEALKDGAARMSTC